MDRFLFFTWVGSWVCLIFVQHKTMKNMADWQRLQDTAINDIFTHIVTLAKKLEK